MTQDQLSAAQANWRQRLRHFLALNIRTKIVLPYLFLTLIVAIIGTYVVTSLVASSLDERLTNHLLEAGRRVSDTLISQEVDHLEAARIVAFTRGFAEALGSGDQESVNTLAQPAAASLGIENLAVLDAEGNQILHVLRRNGSDFEDVADRSDASNLQMVQALLEINDPAAQPRRGIGMHPAAQSYYYFTAVPVGLEGEVIGVIVIGTSLDTIVPEFKAASLADVIIYLDGGRAVSTTFAPLDAPGEEGNLLDELSITPDLYQECLLYTDLTAGENFEVNDRWYRLARGSLQVGGGKIGVFAVVLPSQFIIQAGATSRNTYWLLFTAAMVGVILVGYLISRLITRPLSRLVSTSQAVADGNLGQRTNITSSDEIGVLATTFDGMTERLAERTQALEQTLGRMRAILSSIGDGVILEDLEGNLVPLNTTAEVLLEELAAHYTVAPLREISAAAREQGLDVAADPWMMESRRFEAGSKMISAHSAAVRTDDGRRLGNVVVLRDVSAEVEAERLKDAFVSHVSHELRTPLTAIKGYSGLLLASTDQTFGEQQRGFLKTINRHTNNLVAMVEELLDFSEMEASGQLGLQRRPIQLSELVAEITTEWRPEIEEKGLTFDVHIPSDRPVVDADPRRLRWAIINLIRNAWQYTPSGGRLAVEVSESENHIVLDVSDTGLGIPVEEQEKLFTRFYRPSHQLTDTVRGFGLGLYVTKVIVEAHGGEIRIDSKEEIGSRFTIMLPKLEA